ncbi:MAG TPA: hypothetical protein VEK34_03305 [Methylocella sp.]|nr:hypothetical protein [Methylocella sp.]
MIMAPNENAPAESSLAAAAPHWPVKDRAFAIRRSGRCTPAEKVAIRLAREIIRLKFSAHIPARKIAWRLGRASATISETLRRFGGAGLTWPYRKG